MDQLKAKMNEVMDQYSKESVVVNLAEVAQELMDKMIQDANYQRNGSNQANIEYLCASDDGLILSNIQTRAKRLEVIKQFMLKFDLSPSSDFLPDLEAKLKISEVVRTFQESLKHKSYGVSSDACLTLRLINETLKNTASIYFGKTDMELNREGTTATHVVYSNLTNFNAFIAYLLEATLKSSMQSTILLPSEKQEELTQSCALILDQIIDNVPFDLLVTASTLQHKEIVENLSLLLVNNYSQDEKEFLEKQARVVLTLLDNTAALPDSLAVECKESIIRKIYEVCGLDVAIQHAAQFSLMTTFTELIYKGGQAYYPQLYAQIDSGDLSLKKAVRVIYECDRQKVQASMHKSAGQHVGNFSPDYSLGADYLSGGCQIFNIFEARQDTRDALKLFLLKKNKTLYSMYLVRNESNQDQSLLEAEVHLQDKVQNCNLLDTQQSLASLGNQIPRLTSQVDMNQSNLNKVFLARSRVSKVLRDMGCNQVQPVTEDVLDKAFEQEKQQTNSDILAVKQQLDLVFSLRDGAGLNDEQVQQLMNHEFQRIVGMDRANITQLNLYLNNQDIQFTEDQQRLAVEESLLYRCCVELIESDQMFSQLKQYVFKQADLAQSENSLKLIFHLATQSRQGHKLF